MLSKNDIYKGKGMRFLTKFISYTLNLESEFLRRYISKKVSFILYFLPSSKGTQIFCNFILVTNSLNLSITVWIGNLFLIHEYK